MKFESLRDILAFALSKEESAVQLYRNLAARVQTLEAANFFKALADREEEHVQAIQLEFMKYGYTVAEEAPPREDNDVTLDLGEQAGEITFLDALQMGIQKERSSFRMYVRLLARETDSESQEMFLNLAEEEMRHVLKLESEMEILAPPHKE